MGRLRAWLADSGPVVVLAMIAAVGSFDHISSLARTYGQHGWRSWAVAVCIDLLCVMAAGEIQRDKRTGRRRRGLLSWPSLVLAGGIVLTLAANLAEAPSSAWGWILAATPAGAFLIAMSMLERRASHRRETAAGRVRSGLVWEDTAPPAPTGEVPQREDSAGIAAEQVWPNPPELEVDPAERAELPPSTGSARTAPAGGGEPGPPPALLAYARRLAAEHRAAHDRPVTADVLRSRMHIAPELAASLLAHLED